MGNCLAVRPSYIAFLSSVTLLLALAAAPARGEEANEVTRSLGLSGDEPTAVSRFPRPASSIAENLTVITAEEIARINAHTVADVLHTVPGVQLDQMQTPGSALFFSVLGATSRHILVQIDGVPQNFISAENVAHIGSMPVQMIERIEIVKGAASAAWGSALGGVVNIITRIPAADRAAGGTLSASTGKSATSDLRAELSGTVRRLGYYLTAGTLRSAGLVPGNETDLDHGFGKFTYDLPSRARMILGIDARHNRLGTEEVVSYDLRNTGTIGNLGSYLTLQYPLAARLGLELTGRGGVREVGVQWGKLSAPVLFRDAKVKETYQGAGAVLSWGDARTALKAGLEYEHTAVRQRELVTLSPEFNSDLALERWSGYLNGTYTLGRVSILPGVRLEHLNMMQDPLSYTLGATLRLSESTLLRGYAARGYSMPLISNLGQPSGERRLQQVRTAQAGVESAALPYLWLKGTLFYNSTWNIQNFDRATSTFRLDEQIRKGVDLELRTSAVYGIALNGAYTFTELHDKRTGANESGPRQVAKLGLNYDNPGLGLIGAVTASYVLWRLPEEIVKSEDVVWDLHLTRRLSPCAENSPELFFSLHNIFNGAQYLMDFHPNAPRWFEAGARYRF